jgi:3-methylfumaryl-CoA hydratase
MLTFVTVRAEIEQDGEIVITEEQDIVYRTGAAALASATRRVAETESVVESAAQSPFRLELDVDTALLFRFSALTYNAHRIHYDQKYASEEGYPDLVVHGPLQALLMGEAMRRSGHSTIGREFSYRLVSPTYGPQRLTIYAWQGPDGVEARVCDETGIITAKGSLVDVH